MASAVLVRTVVFDQSLYRPSGMVGRWMRKMTLRFSAEAKKAAPKRSGRLAASIRGTVRNPGPKQVQGTIGATAPYTMYVIRGTGWPVKGHGGRIYSRRGFARRSRGLPTTKKFFDTKPRDRSTLRGRPLPGTYLAVGKQSLYPPIIRVTSVRGQEPNNFLEVAWRRTARYHRVLRGAPFPRFG